METDMRHGKNTVDYEHPTAIPIGQRSTLSSTILDEESKQTALSAMYDDLDDATSYAVEAVQRTESLIGRLFGPQPENAERDSSGQDRTAHGAIDALSMKMHLLKATLNQLHAQLNKLEQL